jgi:hypothetical protein
MDADVQSIATGVQNITIDMQFIGADVQRSNSNSMNV